MRTVIQADLSDVVDSRIKPLFKGSFRARLSIEDVDTRGMDVHEVITDVGTTENVVLCVGNPIHVPIIDHYRKGITSNKDPYLRRLIENLMFFNRQIDEHGIKKMIAYLIRVHVRKQSNEPILTYEDLADTVATLVNVYRHRIPPTYRRIVVLYKRDSMLTAAQRREFSLQTSRARLSVLKGEIIHMAALTAIEVTKPELKVTKPRVLKEVDTAEIATVRTMENHMREETVHMLEQINISRNFTSEKILQKFYEYLELPEGTTTREAAFKLNISLSTVAEFNKELRK